MEHPVESANGVLNHPSHRECQASGQLDIEVHELTTHPHEAWKHLAPTIKVKDVLKALPFDSPQEKNSIRFVCISDTHSRVENTEFDKEVPPGDVLLHAGDFTHNSTNCEFITFNDFLGRLPHPIKVVIPGNHDYTLDPRGDACTRWRLKKKRTHPGDSIEPHLQEAIQELKKLISNATILLDSAVEICGIKIYGVPWLPGYGTPGFACRRGQALLDKYKLIPDDVDILLSHGPPLGFGDRAHRGNHVGCAELLSSVRRRIKPKYVVHGHVHEGYGIETDGETTYINASICNRWYMPIRKPIIFDFPLRAPYTRQDFDELVL